MTPKEKKLLLLNAFWDKNIDENQLYDLINGKIKTLPFLDKKLIFARLLSTYDWYTLIKLIPVKILKESLSDDVLEILYPKELKEKYKYARKILFK
ncbi:MAG: hypothetical protein KAI40_09990 [Desulfobacterales bacterium]|nr:hypothetical protein [Desulfobacterales bacterium]